MTRPTKDWDDVTDVDLRVQHLRPKPTQKPGLVHVYVAGAFTAPTPLQVEQNILAAEAVAAEIIRSTERVVCLVPHSLGRNFKHGPGSPQYWYEATLSLLKRCDALVLVPGWLDSSGTLNEIEWCRTNDVPVYQDVAELVASVTAQPVGAP